MLLWLPASGLLLHDKSNIKKNQLYEKKQNPKIKKEKAAAKGTRGREKKGKPRGEKRKRR